ncbi:MBL fold metallo-hydrolase [Cellulomonas algicola]|uniref:MBL fold metallo-hydrolase n=1 Tax=Cellulomonas algicola TaxID=2071633 RepID=A0A401V1J2_9CELL|nr:MBL fold metallo-hydrolase [Cellulomonas algicola]GCD20769.1 MBL fold metallo-hydrolase [Cellulomonas algicola]
MTVELTLLEAGHTTHSAGVARRGAGRAPVRFPALVGVVRHAGGVVLVDTGYAPRVVEALSHGIDRVYGGLLPVHVGPDESAVAQLAARGIDADDVTHVVVTHLHADHVGGLRDFPAARVVVARRAVDEIARVRGVGRLRRGLAPVLLPDDLADRLLDPMTLPRADDADVEPLGGARDLLGDGTVVVVPLPGHATGHLGVLVRTATRDVLLVGDAAWDRRAVTHRELPAPVVRLLSADWPRYTRTIDALHRLAERRPDLIVLPAHDEAAIAEARAELAT